ncbi:hypothetical protein [Rummeliibacillus pycnus]|uniref:hypothetical protein n=1 Tax=Rummeliibacillus pycnus TaxID=101070 RepID=UPI000C9A5790|nr:hypothetical protein [Rummeliibacillus pycnus]
MWINVVFTIFSIMGLSHMWFAIFGKKKDFNNLNTGGSSSLVELIFDLTYQLSPLLIKRILTFLLGLFGALLFIILLYFYNFG